MVVIGLLEYSHSKKINLIQYSLMKTIFGSECSKGIFTEINKEVKIPGRHVLTIHITEAKWHVKDTPGSYLTSAAF